MADTIQTTPALNLVAIDIARYWNYVLVENSAVKRQRFKMTNTATDFDRLIQLLGSRSARQYETSQHGFVLPAG